MGDFRPEDREKLAEVHTMLRTQSASIRDHEGRIRHVEGRITWGMGVVAGVGFLLGGAAKAMLVKLGVIS